MFQSMIGWRTAPKIRFTDSPDLNDDPMLIVLDTGIAISETPKNLTNFKSLFRMVVEKKVAIFIFGRTNFETSNHTK